MIIDGDDLTWLQTEDRSPIVRLRANPYYWDRIRGPQLQEVGFRNDLSREQGIDLVCDAVGEVDIVTEVPPAQATGCAVPDMRGWSRRTRCDRWPA